MRRVFKYIVSRTYKPLLVKYLTGTRNYRYKNIELQIPPDVFHPGFFFSTRILLCYISKQSIVGKTFLELGAGSGLIAIYASQLGAVVTASDINPTSIATLKKNRQVNKADFEIIYSDLFDAFPSTSFDFIAINPPYYKKTPVTNKDHAWYCGENGEYFDRLFAGLQTYTHHHTEVVMVFCDGCDLEMIKALAAKHCYRMVCVEKTKNLLEENFIYKIERVV